MTVSQVYCSGHVDLPRHCSSAVVATLLTRAGLTRAELELGRDADAQLGALSDQIDRYHFFGAEEAHTTGDGNERELTRDRTQTVEGDLTVLAVPAVAELYLRLLPEYAGVAVPEPLRRKARGDKSCHGRWPASPHRA